MKEQILTEFERIYIYMLLNGICFRANAVAYIK